MWSRRVLESPSSAGASEPSGLVVDCPKAAGWAVAASPKGFHLD